MRSCFIAHGLPNLRRLIPSNVSFGHAMKSKGADDIQMLEHERPDILRLRHAGGVGRQHDWLLGGKLAAEGLKLAEERDDFLPIAILRCIAFVGDQAAVGLLSYIPAIERRMMAITLPQLLGNFFVPIKRIGTEIEPGIHADTEKNIHLQ